MIRIKRNGSLTFQHPQFLRTVGGIYMELPTQSHIPLCSGNVLTFRDFPPRAIPNAILSHKPHLSRNRTGSLHTMGIVVPQQHDSQKQKHNDPRNMKPYFIFKLDFRFSVHGSNPFCSFLT